MKEKKDALTELGIRHNTDKADPHYFTKFYDKHFGDKREQVLNVLEIGVANGSSHRMWRDYFPKATIYGIDVSPGSLFEEDRIKTFLVGQEDGDKLDEIFSGIEFDIILDDGNHVPETQISTFLHLKKFVKAGGYYVVEDLHTSYTPGFMSYESNADKYFRDLNLEEHGVEFAEFYSNLDKKHNVKCITCLIKLKN